MNLESNPVQSNAKKSVPAGGHAGYHPKISIKNSFDSLACDIEEDDTEDEVYDSEFPLMAVGMVVGDISRNKNKIKSKRTAARASKQQQKKRDQKKEKNNKIREQKKEKNIKTEEEIENVVGVGGRAVGVGEPRLASVGSEAVKPGLTTAENECEEDFARPTSLPRATEENKFEEDSTRPTSLTRKKMQEEESANAGDKKSEDLNVLIGDVETYQQQHQAEIHNLTECKWLHTDPATGWRCIRTVIDSGASDSVAPPSLAPEVAIMPSPGSMRGQTYSGAVKGARDLANKGEKYLCMVTRDGIETTAKWQIVDVNRPLSAVRRMCKQGNRVIFGLHGGVVQNIETGVEIPFEVENEIYTMELWLPPNASTADQGFRRQS
jgi:hypothetical protein